MDQILYEVADRIAVITLNRPEAANAQSFALLDDLDAAWTRAAMDDRVRVIVLKANGRHLSAGQNHLFALRQAKRAVNQALDVQGFYAAIQSAFDIHQTGHGNALSVAGFPVLMQLDGMKDRLKPH